MRICVLYGADHGGRSHRSSKRKKSSKKTKKRHTDRSVVVTGCDRLLTVTSACCNWDMLTRHLVACAYLWQSQHVCE